MFARRAKETQANAKAFRRRPSSESVGLLALEILVVDGGAVSGGLGAAPVIAVAVLLHLGPGAVVVEGIEGPGGLGGEGG